MEGDETRERFKRAVADCTPKLDADGNDGMRTHLIVVHWMLGSSQAFRLALEETTLGEHPQEIWAVDLGGWPNREPTERSCANGGRPQVSCTSETRPISAHPGRKFAALGARLGDTFGGTFRVVRVSLP